MYIFNRNRQSIERRQRVRFSKAPQAAQAFIKAGGWDNAKDFASLYWELTSGGCATSAEVQVVAIIHGRGYIEILTALALNKDEVFITDSQYEANFT